MPVNPLISLVVSLIILVLLIVVLFKLAALVP